MLRLAWLGIGSTGLRATRTHEQIESASLHRLLEHPKTDPLAKIEQVVNRLCCNFGQRRLVT